LRAERPKGEKSSLSSDNDRFTMTRALAAPTEELHAANRYDRLTHGVEVITGRPATSIRDYGARHPELFGPTGSAASR
jgi:hypothetical protein